MEATSKTIVNCGRLTTTVEISLFDEYYGTARKSWLPPDCIFTHDLLDIGYKVELSN
jgi:hypothetical protein